MLNLISGSGIGGGNIFLNGEHLNIDGDLYLCGGTIDKNIVVNEMGTTVSGSSLRMNGGSIVGPGCLYVQGKIIP